MLIKTNFDVNNLVKQKFQFDVDGKINALEIMVIQTETCYAGTQSFYQCRPIVAHKDYKNKYKDEGEFKWVIGYGISKENLQLGWQKFREDELISLAQNEIDIILGSSVAL